ncbi:MAG: fibrobacter succinogenes major paralogous domain-containing protein [Ignavibacteria bacterium]|nr:fibrobacter succinogenes major paralogous domain-containing protein [Ignavibacteria bacterium]
MEKKSVLKSSAFIGAILFLAFANSKFNTSVLLKDDSLKVKVDTIENNKYPSVKIGNQEWMTENLNVDRFQNGDPIPELKGDSKWFKARDEKKPAWCYYDNDPANGKIYGKLYNWYAVNDPRGLAPEGWHVPSDKEWTILIEYLGGKEKKVKFDDGTSYWYTPTAGGKMKSTGTQYWRSHNEDATNSSGFSGLPGGYRDFFGNFYDIGLEGNWSCSSENKKNYTWTRSLDYLTDIVNKMGFDKNYGHSVRCLRD